MNFRLQREEEAAYASSHGAQTQSHSQPAVVPHLQPGHTSLGPFSKFEEKKTNEKMRKVTTVKKFFSPSSRTPPKKGVSTERPTRPCVWHWVCEDSDPPDLWSDLYLIERYKWMCFFFFFVVVRELRRADPQSVHHSPRQL